MSNKKIWIISIGILLTAALITFIIFSTEPTAKKSGATKETAMLVDVTKVEYGQFRPTIVSTGTVRPVDDINLSPRVTGQVISLADGFEPGGNVKEGEVLLQIDPADYQNILMLRKSDLHQAIADLNIEEGRQDVAMLDYQLIGDTLAEEDLSLVLREPQLNAVKARVEAARAAVKQAELDLQRTTIRSPFDAHILSRNVNIGSQIAPGDDLGRLVGMDEYWVIVTVPVAKLRWLRFPDEENPKGSEVRIRNRSAWEDDEYRVGYLDRLIGSLEDQTRLARVLVSVPDPLGQEVDSIEVPQLMIGAFVEASVMGREIKDVIRLERNFVRNNETVWVMDDGKLRIRNIDIVMNDAMYAYIREGLEANDQIVTTNLSTVTDGAPLRVSEAGSTGSESRNVGSSAPTGTHTAGSTD